MTDHVAWHSCFRAVSALGYCGYLNFEIISAHYFITQVDVTLVAALTTSFDSSAAAHFLPGTQAGCCQAARCHWTPRGWCCAAGPRISRCSPAGTGALLSAAALCAVSYCRSCGSAT